MLINKSLFPVSRTFNTISNMQQQMQKLQMQLATGERASVLSELGQDISYDLTIRSRKSTIGSYQANIQAVNLRIDFLNNSMERLDKIDADARSTALSEVGGEGGSGLATAQGLAHARLDEVLSLMRTEVNGRYLFGGNVTDQPPVAELSAILDGVNGQAGLKTLIGERKLADAGADGRGRLVTDIAPLTSASPAVDTVSLTEADATTSPHRRQITAIATSNPAEITVNGPAGVPVAVDVQFGAGVAANDTVTIDITLPDGTVQPQVFTAVVGAPVNPGEFEIGATPTDTANNFRAALDTATVPTVATLAEDGAHPFGFKLSTLSSSSAAVALGAPGGGPPQALSVRFTGDPIAGDEITIGLTLPDGQAFSLNLTATAGTPEAGEFQIGATPQDTTANFQAALNDALELAGNTDLAASSTYAASDSFFAGQGETTMRVDGPPYETATALVAATTTDTVSWYSGQNDSTSARQSVQAKVADGSVVNYGVRANEKGIVDLVRTLAAMAVETYSSADPNAEARYKAMANGQLERLTTTSNSQSGSIRSISIELAIAHNTGSDAAERHKTHQAQLDGILSDIETVPKEEVAMRILELQTRLQASYQTTSIVSQLTLVNFIN